MTTCRCPTPPVSSPDPRRRSGGSGSGRRVPPRSRHRARRKSRRLAPGGRGDQGRRSTPIPIGWILRIDTRHGQTALESVEGFLLAQRHEIDDLRIREHRVHVAGRDSQWKDRMCCKVAPPNILRRNCFLPDIEFSTLCRLGRRGEGEGNVNLQHYIPCRVCDPDFPILPRYGREKRK